MTRDDAVTIVAMMVHGFPGPAWEEERMAIYVEDLLPLDAALTTHALARARNSQKYAPSISELKEFYAIERRKEEAEQRDRIRAQLDETPGHQDEIPTWVKRWLVARFLVAPPDLRMLKEQHLFGPEPEGVEWLPDDLYVEEAAKITDAQVWRTMSAGMKLSQPEADDAIVTAWPL